MNLCRVLSIPTKDDSNTVGDRSWDDFEMCLQTGTLCPKLTCDSITQSTIYPTRHVPRAGNAVPHSSTYRWIGVNVAEIE